MPASSQCIRGRKSANGLPDPLSPPNWRNEVTLRSIVLARAYEPGAYISFISPTPLLMILGRTDTITCMDLQLDAFNKALEPKKLVLLVGGTSRASKRSSIRPARRGRIGLACTSSVVRLNDYRSHAHRSGERL